MIGQNGLDLVQFMGDFPFDDGDAGVVRSSNPDQGGCHAGQGEEKDQKKRDGDPQPTGK
jgi:hypothetical protein